MSVASLGTPRHRWLHRAGTLALGIGGTRAKSWSNRRADAVSLPIIWDADFLYGPRTATGEDTYILCEINVSCVFAIPDEAPAAIASLVLERVRQA
jgi:hypothetical protein